MTNPATRATDGRVEFEGGYATGAGLYNGTDRPVVEAHPDGGYEVSYFYGGPTNEPKKYDYSQTGTSLFNVDLGGQDHTFHCGFKEKKRNLTVNAGTGGSVSPSGTNSYRVKKPIDITATPDNGYEFTGWTITEGDVTIKDPSSLTTTATLHNTNSTITANFEPPISISNFIIVGNNGIILSKGQRYIVGSVDWKNVIYANGKYVAVGGNKYGSSTGYITSSVNGLSWNTPEQIGYLDEWWNIVYANGKFVAVGGSNTGYITTSINGSNWTTPFEPGAGGFRGLYAVAYGNGKFVAVGENTNFTISTDGTNWTTPKTISYYDTLHSITFGNGKFVAVGNTNGAGIITTSSDGITWTSVQKIGSNTWYSITYENGKFIVVGANGYIVTSSDGITWTSPKKVGTNNWKSIIYSNGKFIIAGDKGYITTSIDGENWTTPEQIRDESGNVVTVNLNGVCVMPD